MNGSPSSFAQKSHVNLNCSRDLSLEYEDLKYDGDKDTNGNYLATGSPVAIEEILTYNIDNEMPTIEVAADSSQQVAVDRRHPRVTGDGARDYNTIFGFSSLTYLEDVRSWSGKFATSFPTLCNSPAVPVDEDRLPGMIRSMSGSLSSDGDETMSGCDDDTDAVEPVIPVKGVSFNERVRVLPIPPNSSYTSEQRFRMYANRFELRENKLRNKKEYAFDGYDWRNATEEGNMAICPLSGELLHPAHL